MEIERKWLIDGFVQGLPIVKSAVMHQGYISCEPVVRIRSTELENETSYILCFKGKGGLVREEIETPIDKETFEKLRAFIGTPLIRKDYREYRLPQGELLEVSIVDKGTETEFMYAEVEFESIEQANSFTPPSFLGEEKTEDHSFSMSRYWQSKAEKYKNHNL